MFSRTVSLEDIVDRAYQLLLVSVSSRLATSSEDARSVDAAN